MNLKNLRESIISNNTITSINESLYKDSKLLKSWIYDGLNSSLKDAVKGSKAKNVKYAYYDELDGSNKRLLDMVSKNSMDLNIGLHDESATDIYLFSYSENPNSAGTEMYGDSVPAGAFAYFDPNSVCIKLACFMSFPDLADEDDGRVYSDVRLEYVTDSLTSTMINSALHTMYDLQYGR